MDPETFRVIVVQNGVTPESKHESKLYGVMAWIETVSQDEAHGDLKDIYDDIVRTRGKVSNIMRIQSLNPAAMKAHMELYMSTVFGRLGIRRADRELIATVVSAANDCAYCVDHHAEALQFYWKDMDRVRRVIADYRSADLSDQQMAMLNYAVKLTRTPSDVSEQDLESMRSEGLSDKDILDINLIAGYFNFVNRLALGLGVQHSSEEVIGFQY